MRTSKTALALFICCLGVSHGSLAGVKKGPFMAAFAKDPESRFSSIRNGVVVANEQFTSLANSPEGYYTNTLRYSNDYGRTWGYPAYPTDHGTYNLCGPDTSTAIRGDVYAVKYLGDDTYSGKAFVMLSTSGIVCTSTTGSAWVMASPSRESAYNNEYRPLYDATYANGTFVAVGGWGLVKYAKGAPSGAWTTVEVGNLDLNSVAFGKGRFVAVGDDSTAWYSADGVTWTQATLSGEADLRRIIFVPEANGGAGQFVAVGSMATIWHSPDGVAWTVGKSNGGDTLFRDVTYADGTYVAVGDDNTASYSNDGMNWITHPYAFYRDDDREQDILTHPHAVIYDHVTRQFIAVTADLDPFSQTGTIFYTLNRPIDKIVWSNARIFDHDNPNQQINEGYLATVIDTDKGMLAIPFGSGAALADAPANVLWSSHSAGSGIVWKSLCGFNGGDCAVPGEAHVDVHRRSRGEPPASGPGARTRGAR